MARDDHLDDPLPEFLDPGRIAQVLTTGDPGVDLLGGDDLQGPAPLGRRIAAVPIMMPRVFRDRRSLLLSRMI